MPGRFRLEPFFALCLLFVWVMAVEIGVMLALPQIVALSQFERALADALALLVGVAPAAYLLGFRPLERRVAERKRLIDGLEEQLQGLSKNVRERSEELAAVSQSLQEQITGRKQEEEVISQLAAIVESSDDAIIGLNPDGLITVWSPAAERLYGYSAEEAKGGSMAKMTPSDRVGELRRISELARGGERLDHYETVQITKDGRLVEVSVSAFPIIDVDGKAIGSGMIVRDMTERKWFEKAIEVAAREWRATIDGIREGVLVLDEALRVTRCNMAMQEQIGSPFSEILGHPCDEFIGCKAEDAEDSVYVQALHSRHEQSQVFAQGERWMSVTAYPLLDMENLVTGVVCVLSDISDRKRAEE
ncbi:MAG: PAS domain S-box protein, partial [Dehalococcoidia bacterium]|nr:PAS domain S-box protein [Dehalococcoidia bacterium]